MFDNAILLIYVLVYILDYLLSLPSSLLFICSTFLYVFLLSYALIIHAHYICCLPCHRSTLFLSLVFCLSLGVLLSHC